MLTVADQIAWDNLPEETRQLAREVLGVNTREVTDLIDHVEELERDLLVRDEINMQTIDEIKRIEEAVLNASTLVNSALKDVTTMLRGLKARLA